MINLVSCQIKVYLQKNIIKFSESISLFNFSEVEPNMDVWTHEKNNSDLEELFFDKNTISVNSTQLNTESGESSLRDSSILKHEENVDFKKINNCLKTNKSINFEYLNSEKVFDPKHLPIEDKGMIYYYQDDPILYKKIKK